MHSERMMLSRGAVHEGGLMRMGSAATIKVVTIGSPNQSWQPLPIPAGQTRCNMSKNGAFLNYFKSFEAVMGISHLFS